MKLYKASDRGKLYQHIFEYSRRREKRREKHGMVNGGRAGWTVPENYKRAVKVINNKIAVWQRAIRMIDERNIKLMAVSNSVSYFTGINVKGSILTISDRYRQARNIFYKYCLENNISATLVAEFVGASRGDIIARGRKNFTKSFDTHPKNRDVYHRFIKYMEEQTENIKSGENEKY